MITEPITNISFKVINFAKDFTDMPIGKYRKHSPFSGEVFREDHLIPALLNYDYIILDLDNVYGYGSSFLLEAFGDLDKKTGLSLDEINSKLELVCTDDLMLLDQIEMLCGISHKLKSKTPTKPKSIIQKIKDLFK